MAIKVQNKPQSDIVIIGAGIVGLALARSLQLRNTGKRIKVLEKESRIGAHQTGHNSGVIHSGIYYKPGSLKARLCIEGSRRMYEFAAENGIAHERCGKVVAATDKSEVPRLQTLYERGIANGAVGLEMLNAEKVREREPHIRALQGIWAPSTGIIDYPAVAEAMRRQFEAAGGEVAVNTQVCSIRRSDSCWNIETTNDVFRSTALINCAGLYSDRIAQMAGVELDARIIPFRGEYYSIKPERAHLIKNLVYPVPDPSFPFLGVHFTRTVHHGIEAGPNAVLALSREGYGKTDMRGGDVSDIMSWPGFQKMAARYWRAGLGEMMRSASKSLFTRSLQKMAPEIQASDLIPGGSGVRAQAVTREGSLVDDFLIVEQEGRAAHVLNVVSPAATASLAIADYVADHYAQSLLDA